jgi:putative copper resistance protein D
MADIVAIGMRALAFAAALSAAGAAIFVWLFGAALDRSARRIRVLTSATALIGLLFTLAHAVVEPVRLAGAWTGIVDASLQALLLGSDFGTATAVRVLGLSTVLAGSLRPGRAGDGLALAGALLIAVSFAFMGHTAADPQRWLLAPLLIVHLVAVAFWFGALWPLAVMAQHESPALAGPTIGLFSAIAVRIVPGIFVAGVALAALLLPGWSSLRTAYGFSLMAKVAGFTTLMGLAALNKWRFGPAIGRGDATAVAAFRRTIAAEWLLILGVVAVTATMTALFDVRH